MGGSHGEGIFAGGEKKSGFPDSIADAGFQQGGVHKLSVAGFETLDVGAEDPVGCITARVEVGDGDADFDRGGIPVAGCGEPRWTPTTIIGSPCPVQ